MLALQASRTLFRKIVSELMLKTFQEYEPTLHSNCFVATSADVIGQVTLAKDSSVWFQAVLRGDNDKIEIGEGTNVQDGVIIHVDPGKPCKIGRRCVLGHRAVLHGCTLGDEVLVGIGAIILNGAVIPDGCLIGAGALVSEGKQLEAGSLYVGVPARKVRALSPEEREAIVRNAEGYTARAKLYKGIGS